MMEKDSSADMAGVKREYLSEADDEISLVELWMILVKRWKIVCVIFVLCLILGIVIAISAPVKYLFSTTVELAPMGAELAEPVASTLSKLKGDYIPQVLVSEKDGELFGVDAHHPRGSKAIVLTSSGLVTDAESIRGVHRSIFDLLVKGQHTLIEQQRIPGKQEYSLLESRIKIDLLRIEKLRESEKLLESALIALDEGVLKEVSIGLLQAQALNLHALVAVEKTVAEYQVRLITLQSKIDLFSKAAVGDIALKSLKPIGVGKMVTIFLSAMMGLFIGVIAVFFMEFLAKVRCSMRPAE